MRWTTARREAAQAVLEAAAAGIRPTSVALIGPAGVGKTLLARTFARFFDEARPHATLHWVSATSAASNIPFGALSHLVEIAGRSGPAETLRAALATLCPPGSDVFVVVDDAHLLDDHSAALVHQLVAVASAHVLVTCRSGETVPDAITALWKDDFVTRVDLAPLTGSETTKLLEQVLDGPLDPDTAERIFTLSQGNPLYLRHLVEGAERRGTLSLVDGTWRLHGATPLTRQLAELIDLRLSVLPEAARTVLEYLAVEEPLTVSALAPLTAADAIEAGEEIGAVRVVEQVDELLVYAAHPLYVERLRQSLGRLAARRLRTDVVRQLRSQPPTNVSTRLRLVALALDSDLPPAPGEVVGAAFEALYLNDLPLTERLARAAVDRADSVLARVALAHALCWQGRGEEAEATLAALDTETMTQPELATWVVARAVNRFWVLGQASEAAEWLNSMRVQLPGKSAQLMMDGLAAQFAMNLGQLQRCDELATRVLGTDSASDEAIAWAASSAALTYARTGRLAQVDGYARRCMQTRSPDGVRYTAGLAQSQTAILQGRAGTAFEIATEYLASAGFRPGRAQAQVVLGHVMIAQGNPAGAAATLQAAAPHYSATGDAWESLDLMLLATALGQQGMAQPAAEALRQAQGAHDLRTALHRPEMHQARAWTLAAARNVTGAVAAARDAVEEALGTGQFGQALLAFHDAIRLGDTVRLRQLSGVVDRLDCALGPLILAHARGLNNGDGDELRSVAAQLEATGMLGAAADAAAQAATAHAARGRRGDELAASTYAVQLRGRCYGLSTPALDAALHPLPLTGREREIATMVADGRSNRAIAEQLGISVRTVEAHIYRACAKLDVVNRSQLGEAVNAAADH